MDPAVDTPLLVERLDRSKFEPDHYITIPASDSTSFFPSWGSQATTHNNSLRFRNPWPSWHTPTRAEVWEHLQWGEDQDTTIQLATSHLDTLPTPPQPPPDKRPRFGDVNNWPNSIGAKASRLLGIQEPDFSFGPLSQNARAKVTWLGHASMLVQFPPLDTTKSNARPIRCLFDPMFSMRCSPNQSAGPIRSYPPPCSVEALPTIDAVFISHNHYDHLDYDTIMAIWKQNKDVVRFFVPMGNKKLFIEYGIRESQVTEMDWWECATLVPQISSIPSKKLKVWCTPAQHSSSRFGVGNNATLWSSWYLECCNPDPAQTPYRVFVAGDTGYQFHASPSWPPSPNTDTQERKSTIDEPDETFPACPAFAEISERIGAPNLLLMPIWVGATFSYLRSLVPFPDWMSPFPRHAVGLAAANHMPPWDAVKVMKLMTDRKAESPPLQNREGNGPGENRPPIAIAMHWGTFVTDPVEVFKTLGQLEWACKQQGVRFARSLPGSKSDGGGDGVVAEEPHGGSSQEPYFLALNHGQSVYT